jgi:L-rhamnose isomerase
MGCAVKNGLALCLDAGHFHPTEVISAKITAVVCGEDAFATFRARCAGTATM